MSRPVGFELGPLAAAYLLRTLRAELERATDEPNYDRDDMDELVALIALLELAQ